jgi:hypothetical protein
MKSTLNLRLHELPAELAELDELVTDYEAWDVPPNDTDLDEILGDSAAREALGREIERRLQTFEGALRDRGQELHGWLCRLRTESEAAAAELARVRKLAKVRERKLQRVKDYVRTALEAMGLKRIEGEAWRLRVQTNGGPVPILWDERTPVPPALSKPVELDAALLVENFRRRFNPMSTSDAQILRMLGIEPASLEPDPERVRQWIKSHEGEVPAGFSMPPKGTHLRME